MPALLIFIPTFFQRDFFQFADIQRTVVIQAGTVVLALVIANMTGNGGQGVALIDEFQRVGIAVFAKQTDVFRNILLDSAGSNTGGNVAIGQRQVFSHFNTLFWLPVFLGVFHG